MSLLLFFNQASGDATLPVEHGTISFVGKAATFRISLATAPGTVTFSGKSATPLPTFAVTPGTLSFVGKSASFRIEHPVAPGTISFVGKTATPRVNLSTTPGRITFTGLRSDLNVVRPGGHDGRRDWLDRMARKRKAAQAKKSDEPEYNTTPLSEEELPPRRVPPVLVAPYEAPPPVWFDDSLRQAQDERDALEVIALLPDPLVDQLAGIEDELQRLLSELQQAA